MSEWQETTLGELITLQRGHDLAKTEMQQGPIPVAGSNGVIGYHNKATTKALGITIGRSGNIGNAYLYKEDFWAHNTTLYVKDFKGNDEVFVYYLLKSIDFAGFNVGSAVPTLNRNHIHPMAIKKPTVEEQKAIASVLSSLDDKIDLLHRQNATLEAMAKTLFRQWFEEELQDSNIGQLINLQNGYAFKSVDFKDFGEHQVLKIKNISGGIIDVNNTDFLDSSVGNKTDEKFKIGSGDILFAMTGAELGKLGIVPKTKASLWLNQRVGLLKEKYKGARFLAYLQLSSDIGQDYIENSATGSAQPNISGSLIEQCPFPKIEPHLIKERAETLDVYYQKLISNLGQIQILEKLRDNLLPKLMSGEIRVV